MSRPPALPPSLTTAQLRALDPRSRSSIPTFLRRLTWIIALVLGGGSIVAGIWSRLVLPLLWSTFSARQAVTDQTLFGFREIIAGLRTIRSRRFYKHQPVKLERHHHDGQQQLLLLGKDKSAAPPADEQPPPKMMGESLLIEDMSVIDPEHEDVEENELDDPSEPKTPLYLHSDLDILPPLLDTLRLNLAATSTTRTSLLSTLTAYTSQLNTQSFTSWHGASHPGLSSRVGLKSLDENLAKETWNGKEEMVLGRPAPEFEELRKEVRGLKGVLLSRRNFTRPP